MFPGWLVGWSSCRQFSTLRLWEAENLHRPAEQQFICTWGKIRILQLWFIYNHVSWRLWQIQSILASITHTHSRLRFRLIGCDKDVRSRTKVKDGWHHFKQSSIHQIIYFFVWPLTTQSIKDLWLYFTAMTNHQQDSNKQATTTRMKNRLSRVDVVAHAFFFWNIKRVRPVSKGAGRSRNSAFEGWFQKKLSTRINWKWSISASMWSHLISRHLLRRKTSGKHFPTFPKKWQDQSGEAKVFQLLYIHSVYPFGEQPSENALKFTNVLSKQGGEWTIQIVFTHKPVSNGWKLSTSPSCGEAQRDTVFN